MKLPLRKVYVKLRYFKAIYLGKFKYRIKRNNLNHRRPTVERREKLEGIYEIYKNLSLENQLGVASETVYKLGNFDKMSNQAEEIEETEISLLDIDKISE